MYVYINLRISLLSVFIGLTIYSFYLNLTELDMQLEYNPYIFSRSPNILRRYVRYIKPTLSATFVFTFIMKSIDRIVSGSINWS